MTDNVAETLVALRDEFPSLNEAVVRAVARIAERATMDPEYLSRRTDELKERYCDLELFQTDPQTTSVWILTLALCNLDGMQVLLAMDPAIEDAVSAVMKFAFSLGRAHALGELDLEEAR